MSCGSNTFRISTEIRSAVGPTQYPLQSAWHSSPVVMRLQPDANHSFPTGTDGKNGASWSLINQALRQIYFES
jgi:hypothetical protein